MTRTLIRGAFFTVLAVALLSLFASRPAWAPSNDQPEQIAATNPDWPKKAKDQAKERSPSTSLGTKQPGKARKKKRAAE